MNLFEVLSFSMIFCILLQSEKAQTLDILKAKLNNRNPTKSISTDNFPSYLPGLTSARTTLKTLKNGNLIDASIGYIIIWDTGSASIETKLNDDTPYFSHFSVVELDNGDLVSAGDDSIIRVWDINYDSVKYTITTNHTLWISALALIGNDIVATAGGDKTIKLWNVTTGELLRILLGHKTELSALTVLNNGLLVSGDSFGEIKLWNAKIGQLLLNISTDVSNDINYLAVLLSGELATPYSANSKIAIWDTSAGRLKKTLSFSSYKINSLYVMAKSGYLISGHQEGYINIWDALSGQLKQTYRPHLSNVAALTELQNGLLASASSQYIRIIDPESPTLSNFTLPYLYMTGYSPVIAALNNGYLAVANQNLSIFDTKEGIIKQNFTGFEKRINDLIVLDSGDLVAASQDANIYVWDSDKGALKNVLKGHNASVTRLALLSNGDLVSKSQDNTIKVWDVIKGSVVLTIKGSVVLDESLAVLKNGNIVNIGTLID
jgi:WD40 repeat protein